MYQLGQRAEGSDQADVVRVVVNHYSGVCRSVQLGVDVDGGCDVPAPPHYPCVLVDNADV